MCCIVVKHRNTVNESCSHFYQKINQFWGKNKTSEKFRCRLEFYRMILSLIKTSFRDVLCLILYFQVFHSHEVVISNQGCMLKVCISKLFWDFILTFWLHFFISTVKVKKPTIHLTLNLFVCIKWISFTCVAKTLMYNLVFIAITLHIDCVVIGTALTL